MEIKRHTNGLSLKFKNTLFVFNFWITYKTQAKKIFLFQFNRFENGYCTIYLRLFKKISLNITDIKLKQGKRYFFGNIE